MRVAVAGAAGRMGSQTVRAIEEAPDLELVAGVGRGDDLTAAADAEVLVDFTTPQAVLGNVLWAIERDIHAVVGTSGLDGPALDQIEEQLQAHPGVGVVVASNFSVGALLLIDAARRAARFYESVEIIEMHHPDKLDAPSGTARTTAQQIAAAREQAGLPAVPDATQHDDLGTRGGRVDGIPVHSVRLRGMVASQEVMFGAPGETLVLRHDSLDRASFMPGVLAAVRAVGEHPALTLGIESLLGIGQ